MEAVDAILAEVHGVQSASQVNPARKRKEPRSWGAPPLSLHKYREKHAGADGKGGCYVCYGQNRDHRHDQTRCEVTRGRRRSTSSAVPTKPLSATSEGTVIPANIV